MMKLDGFPGILYLGMDRNNEMYMCDNNMQGNIVRAQLQGHAFFISFSLLLSLCLSRLSYFWEHMWPSGKGLI